MLGKLWHGELSLKESFWKFGVLGLLACAFITKIIKVLLLRQLGGVDLIYYYTHYFLPLKMNGMLMFLTLLYFFAAFVLCVYGLIVVFGVWRSAAEYTKSIWLRQIARIFILIVVYLSIRIGL